MTYNGEKSDNCNNMYTVSFYSKCDIAIVIQVQMVLPVVGEVLRSKALSFTTTSP